MTRSGSFFLAFVIFWICTIVASAGLKNFTLEFLLKGLPDILDDPELALVFVVLLLLVCAAIAIIRQLVKMIVSFPSGDWRGGPQGLGLS